jgi:hypothetical protein
MKLDRALQLELLKELAEAYPAQANVQQHAKDNPEVTPNMHYLYGHGLIDGDISSAVASTSKHFLYARITVNGLDLLAEDGGLSAILGVLTVKLHDDTIKSMVEARISRSDLSPEDKQGWIDQLRDLRGESIKYLTMKLLDAGLESWPRVLHAIQTSSQ